MDWLDANATLVGLFLAAAAVLVGLGAWLFPKLTRSPGPSAADQANVALLDAPVVTVEHDHVIRPHIGLADHYPQSPGDELMVSVRFDRDVTDARLLWTGDDGRWSPPLELGPEARGDRGQQFSLTGRTLQPHTGEPPDWLYYVSNPAPFIVKARRNGRRFEIRGHLGSNTEPGRSIVPPHLLSKKMQLAE